jgi:hypothetical protein
VDRVEILWPSGSKQEVNISSVDRILTVEEGKAAIEK